ncbi:MAG: sigma-70 family RNA polymerase sigma factor [Roseibacillus sp.]|nr:sigma-70 family RNA polymerase sigma factor [Roseibacillus sp.]
MAALAAGQPALFDAVVIAETGTLLGFFRRLGAGPGEAEDLVQDTIVKLFRSAQRYQSNDRFEAYAFRAARNVWIDSRRRAGVRERAIGGSSEDREDVLESIRGREEEPFESLELSERSQLLDEAVSRLDEAHRVVFELGVLQGLSYAEVSELVDIPVGTVKSRVHHAVRKLREMLGSEGVS